MGRNLYDVLGVKKTDEHDVIKKAFRKLARQTHPDRNKDDAKAEARFKEVGGAWDVLGDEEKRSNYDMFGDASTKPGFDAGRARAYQAGGGHRVDFGGGGGGVDLGDILGGMFGFGGARGAKSGGFSSGFGPGSQGFGGSGFSSGFGPSPGRDLQATLPVDFEMAVRGGERSITLEGGRAIAVRIPEGVRNGETLKLRGKGGVGSQGGHNGDLLIHIVVRSHASLRRDGLDLLLDQEITAVQAIRGGKVTVSTLSGDVKLTVKPGTQSGQRLRLTGKGVTRRGKVGNLLVTLRVVLPSLLPEDVLDALQAAYDSENSGD